MVCVFDVKVFSVFFLVMTSIAIRDAHDASAQEGPRTSPEIRAKCTKEWATDYVMQKHCIERQNAALISVNRYLDQIKDDEDVQTDTLLKCSSDWKDEIGYDWVMVNYCIDKQTESYRALQQ